MVTYTFATSRFNRLGGGRVAYTTAVNVPEPRNTVEKRLQDFVLNSILKKKAYRLLPFIFENASMLELAKHLLFHRTGSCLGLYGYALGISRFCTWIDIKPDQLVNDCKGQDFVPNLQKIAWIRHKLDDFIMCKKEQNLSPMTIYTAVKNVEMFFRINEVNLNLNFRLPKRIVFSSRSLSLEELQKILSIADLREKVIISILAVSGLRTGTLVQLQYRHVRNDLEKEITPIHLHIEAKITKGKYHGYSTFINYEAAQYLKAYLDARRKGSKKVPPENIHDESPLIRIWYHKGKADPMSAYEIGYLLRKLFFKSGIVTKKPGTKMYELNTTSLRKFFRTQMAVLGVERQFIEYMMGHKSEQYVDVKMVGTEYLRRVYQMSGISIEPQTEADKLSVLKQTIQKLGYDPEEVLRPEILCRFTEERLGTAKAGKPN